MSIYSGNVFAHGLYLYMHKDEMSLKIIITSHRTNKIHHTKNVACSLLSDYRYF